MGSTEKMPIKHPSRVPTNVPVKSSSNNGDEFQSDSASSVDTVPVTKQPKMFKVILLNDDYTPMDFVVHVLQRFFNKTEEQAIQVMLDVHKKGAGVAGVYTLEVAEMKVMQANQYSQMNKHPLKSTMEEA